MVNHYKLVILRFAYLHIHPGTGIEGLIKLKPGFQTTLDSQARLCLAELMDCADAHVPHDTRNAMGFDDWLQDEPTEYEHIQFEKWVYVLMERPTGWEEVDTSNG